MWSSRVVMCFLFACYAIPAVGDWNDVRIRAFTDAELMALPPYCAPRMRHTPGQYDHWLAVLGSDYEHTHHYCEGLGYLNRSYRARSQQESKDLLRQAYSLIGYLISRAQPTYSLMPEAYFNRGLVLSLMKRDGEAIKDLMKAIELNPRTVRAYLLASELLTKMKMKDEALKLVAEGLGKNPGHKGLQRAYDKLGGKLPYPEPIARAAEVPAAPDQARREGETAAGEGKSKDTVQLAPASPAPDAAAGGGRADAQAPATPKIGSPTNPWCRFCPDPAK